MREIPDANEKRRPDILNDTIAFPEFDCDEWAKTSTRVSLQHLDEGRLEEFWFVTNVIRSREQSEAGAISVLEAPFFYVLSADYCAI